MSVCHLHPLNAPFHHDDIMAAKMFARPPSRNADDRKPHNVIQNRREMGKIGTLTVPRSPRNRVVAAIAGCGRCELPAIMRATPRNRAIAIFCGLRSEKPCDFCNGMAASLLVATVVAAILRCVLLCH